MKGCLVSIVLLLASCAKAPIQPAVMPAVQPRVAILDIQKAVTSTREGKMAAADMHRRFDPDIKRLDQERLELEKMRKQLATSGSIEEVETRQRRYNREMEDGRQRVEVEQKRLLKDLTAKLMVIAGEYAKQNRFDAVLDVSQALWRADHADITDKVIELYDLKYR
jgi:Skp family chaperone for outer membrane proteins